MNECATIFVFFFLLCVENYRNHQPNNDEFS